MKTSIFLQEASLSVHDISDKESEASRSRSSTIGSQSDIKERLHTHSGHRKESISPEKGPEKGPKSPLMDM